MRCIFFEEEERACTMYAGSNFSSADMAFFHSPESQGSSQMVTAISTVAAVNTVCNANMF